MVTASSAFSSNLSKVTFVLIVRDVCARVRLRWRLDNDRDVEVDVHSWWWCDDDEREALPWQFQSVAICRPAADLPATRRMKPLARTRLVSAHNQASLYISTSTQLPQPPPFIAAQGPADQEKQNTSPKSPFTCFRAPSRPDQSAARPIA